MPSLLTAAEAAEVLRLHPVTVRRMAAEGRLAGALRVGARWRFREDELAPPSPPLEDEPRPVVTRRRVRRSPALTAELSGALDLLRSSTAASAGTVPRNANPPGDRANGPEPGPRSTPS